MPVLAVFPDAFDRDGAAAVWFVEPDAARPAPLLCRAQSTGRRKVVGRGVSQV